MVRLAYRGFLVLVLAALLAACAVPAAAPIALPVMPPSPVVAADAVLTEPPSAMPIPVVWDDDGSIDGVTALLYFLQNPGYEVKAATVSPGIAHPGIFAANLTQFFTLLGEEDIPVAAGPEQPLAGDTAFPDEWRVASDQFWDLELPTAAVPVDQRSASQLIIDTIKGSDQPVTLFISGPLTNLAQALRDDPSIKDGIRSVEIMGGAVKAPGNVDSSPAEWNIYVDPVAASEVFSSGLALHLIPLDATDQVQWSEDDAAAWDASSAPASSVAAQFLRRTLRDWASSRVLIWDLVAAESAANPELCRWQEFHLEVAQAGAANEGQTVAISDQPANVSVCTAPDVEGYKNAAKEVFAKTR